MFIDTHLPHCFCPLFFVSHVQNETLVTNEMVPFLYFSLLYWTEWGLTPRVGQISLTNTSEYRTLVSHDLVRPNGLHLDLNQQKLYIADAHKNTVIQCHANGKVTSLPQLHKLQLTTKYYHG